MAEGLPSPKGVAMEVLQAIAAAGTSAGDLARLVEKDPATTARLLRTVNAPITGVGRNITSVHQAATLLGFQTVKAVTLCLSVLSENRVGRCEGFDYDRFWSESLARAVTMRHLAAHLGALSPDESFTYGLLSLIGRLALAAVFPESYSEVLTAVGGQGHQQLSEAESAVFEIGSDELSALMLQDWGMPLLRLILESERRQEAEDTKSPAVLVGPMMHLSESAAEILVGPAPLRDQLARLTRSASRLGIESAELRSVFENVTREWQASGTDLSIDTREVPSLPDVFAHAGG